MSWNGYLHYIRTKVIEQLQSRQKGQQKNDDRDFTCNVLQYFAGA